MSRCTIETVEIDGVVLSTNDFINAQQLIADVGSDDADPTADEYEDYIANGHNDRGTTGIHSSLPTQTSPPDPITEKAKEVDDTAAKPTNPPVAGCTAWTPGDYDAALSSNYKLRDVTLKAHWPHQLKALPQYGLTEQDRFCNLQALAQNILEPMLARFGAFRINSGLRNANSTSGGVSQHVKGEAVDIQFPGWDYARYWDNAKWVKDNIPYDQFIYEHSSATGSVWYHLSFRRSGNRGKVMTMYRGGYSPGLRRYG